MANIKFTVNGITHEYEGESLDITDGKISIGGKKINLGKKVIVKNIEVNGNLQFIASQSGNVSVTGTVQNVSTMGGDVVCNGDIHGTVSTMSGDVRCLDIGGNVSTMSGDIIKRGE